MDTPTAVLRPLKGPCDITKAWLQDMLCRKDGWQVIVHFHRMETPESQEGYLSEIRFLWIKYYWHDGSSHERHLVFKFLSVLQSKRHFVLNENVGKREVNVNRFFMSEELSTLCRIHGVRLPVPDVYYAGMGPDALTLVLQDMRKDRFQNIPSTYGINFQQTVTALRTIAVIHAVGLTYLELHGIESLSKHIPELSSVNAFLDTYLLSGYLTSLYEGTSVAEVLRALSGVAGLLRLPSADVRLPITLIHGDLWAGQLMYSEDQSQVSILDWQFASTGSQATDIVSLLLMSSEAEVYEDHLTEALSSYWHSFTSTLKAFKRQPSLAFEDLLDAVDKCWQVGFMMLMTSLESHLDQGKITEERVKRVVAFLNNKMIFETALDNSY
ncbi:uncharacterized protein LOC125045068 isoform X2 [Penaeus chinensis]|uniref:uncharacterized protein LOC125045068 isoform X2 n=1 Tax=Penaeus chinensis TaxID=139456 RepID=UPI001FB66D7B|nr:uncharacterized protein LOC125045068 isoform X2 [Penaeus chinensis]